MAVARGSRVVAEGLELGWEAGEELAAGAEASAW